MAIKNKDAVKFVYVNGSSLPTTVDDSTIYIIGETAEMYVGSLKIAARIAVDSELDTTSFNPVENQAVTKELNKKATIASPTFTGTPKAPTAAAGTSTTQIATTAFVQSAITASTIIVDDAISGTSLNPVQNKVIKAVLDAKANLASPTFTGTPKAPTAPSGTNTTQIATTEFVQTSLSDKADISDIPVATTTTPKANGTAAVGSETKWAKGDHVHPSDTTKANLASPTFTGTPKAPTASKGTSTTQLATTAYVQNELVDYIKDNSSAPIAYGTCNTAADVDEKIITLSSDNPDWELEVGSLIAIRFTAKNTATSPTFNVNGTGARPIGYDTSDSNNGWAAGEANVTSLYVYNGTCYMWLSHSVDNNTTYTNATLGQGYATSTPPTSGVAVTATLSSYALTVGGVVVVKFNTNPVPASATLNINSKGAKAIYYRGAAISANTILAGDTATFIYNGSQYHLVAVDRWGQIATTSSDGLMSASDKSKLDGITATYTAVTGKPTSNQTPAFGGTATISQVSQSTTGQVTVTDRTIKIPNSEASTSASGLMSSTDKTKLDGIAEGANAYTHPSYTARTGKPTGNQTPAFGEAATVSQITSDATGHVTGATDRTIKIPNTEATTSTAGLMSASDKSKLDGIATGATKVTVDSAMSTTSTNPVQNKVVKQAIDDAIAASDAMIFKGTLGTSGDITALPTTYKTGWTYRVITAGTYAGNVCEVGDLIVALKDRSGSGNLDSDWTVAQTNINGAITNITTTSPIAVSWSGSSRALSHANSGVTAAAKGDTSNQTPAFGGTFKVPSGTVNATGHLTAFADHTVTIPDAEATTSTSGLMSSTDKTKLDSITATYTAVTGKPTANQTPTFGGTATISQVSQSATGQVSVTDRTIKIPNATATTSASGLMSADDKTKLDGIATGANAYIHPSYTARTGVPTSNQTPTFGGTFTVNQVNCDATGHVTASTSRTITIPNAEATTSTSGLMSSTDKAKVDSLGDAAYLSLPVPIANGGTGSTNITDALNTLQAKSLGHGIAIAANTDLDTICTIGNYYCNTNAIASSLGNCPVTVAFTMYVGNSVGYRYLYQEIHVYSSGDIYYRYNNSPSYDVTKWTDWQNKQNYLPLTGGIVSGATTVQHPLTLYREGTTTQDLPAGIKFSVRDTTTSQTYSNAYLYAYQDHQASTTGTNVVLNSGGGTYIGSGESADSLYNSLRNLDEGTFPFTEALYLTADSDIFLEAGVGTLENRKGLRITGSGALIPVQAETSTNNVHSIGTSTYKWNAMYATTFYGALSGNASSATEFSDTTTVAATGDATGTSAASKKGWSIPLTLANSGVTAGSYGPSSNASPAFGGTFSVPYITVDAKGRATAASTKTITLPSATATTSTAGLMSKDDKTKLDGIVAGASITGVKGNAESSYRTGDVNLTATNVGALPITGGTITDGTTATYINNLHGGIKLEETDNGITANVNPSNSRGWAPLNNTNTLLSSFQHMYYTDGRTGVGMTVRNYNIAEDKMTGYYGLFVAVDKAGAVNYSISDSRAFKNNLGIAYGTCDTGASIATKTITVEGKGFKLSSGAIIGVKFTNTNTASNPTLNVNNTGAKSIWYDTALITTSNQKFAGEANRITFFMYDGTQWVWIGHGANDATGYLPLTGGTVSGATTVQNLLTLYREGTTAEDLPAEIRFSVKDTDTGKTYPNAKISAYQDHNSGTTYGTNMVIFSGGGMFIGSGEASENHYNAWKSSQEPPYLNETMYLTSDSVVNIQANANTIEDRKGVRVTTAGSLIPIIADEPADNVQSIGTSAYKWNAVYASTFYGDLSGNATTATTATTAATATEFSANKAVTLTGDVTGTASSKGGWSVATTLANSGVTAGSYGPSANATPAVGATFNVPYITVDAKGRLTAASTKTVTIPSDSTKANLASPTFTGTPKAPTATAGTNTTQIATTAFVNTAVGDAIAASDAMIFKGTLGTGGTITALPTTYKTGWTYRVITAGTYAGNVCEVGDLIIALTNRSGSGNVNADWTVAQTNIDGAITSISGTSPITVSGSGNSRTIALANSGVAEGSYGPSANASPTFGGTFSVPYITVDAKGRTTAASTKTITLPAAPTTITGNAGSATKLATGRAIDGVTFDGSTAIVHYGTCSTAAGTAAKVVSCTSFTLVTGSTIRVKFTVTNTAASPTLNVNSTGAKNIFYKGVAITTGYLMKDHVYEFVYDGTQYCLVGEIYSATTESIGSASAGTAIAADDITAWSAGTLPTLGTAIPADDITDWSAGTAASASVANGVLTITNGTAPSLTYAAKSIPNVTAVGTLPSLTYTARSIPNISVTNKTVVTAI